MSTMTKAFSATCLALASICAAAQTTGAPPTHPAAGGSDTSASPTTPPTHPAAGTSGATPEAAAGKQNPSVNGYQDSKPSAQDGKRAATRSGSKPAPTDSTTQGNPTSTDSMAKDNKPAHPAAPAKQ